MDVFKNILIDYECFNGLLTILIASINFLMKGENPSTLNSLEKFFLSKEVLKLEVQNQGKEHGLL